MAVIKIESSVEKLKAQLDTLQAQQPRDHQGEAIPVLMPFYSFDLAVGNTVSMPWQIIEIIPLTADARVFINANGLTTDDVGIFIPQGSARDFKVIPGYILQCTGSAINVTLMA